MKKFMFLILILSFYSCEEIMHIEFKSDGKKNLVVEGEITSDTLAHQVILSYTGDYFKKQPRDPAYGAMVTITDGEQEFKLNEIREGIYATSPDVFGIPGKSYTLNVVLQDGREYTGSDQLVYCADFDSIVQTNNYKHFGPPGTNNYGYDVLFFGQEPASSVDNYMFLLYLNDTLYTDTIFEAAFVSDEYFNGSYIFELPLFYIPENDFRGDSMKVTLEMHSISKSYYDYLVGLMLETVWRGSPWDGPPANVPSNINNEARGFFRASDIKRKTKYFYSTPRQDTKK
jgi:hypothetical protein